MSNKYIEKFFLLTEQNIQGNSVSEASDNNLYSKQKFSQIKHSGYVKYLCVALFLACIYYFMQNNISKLHLTKMELLKNNNVKIIAAADREYLSSYIPGFRVGSQRRLLQQVYLKRSDDILLNTTQIDNDYMQQARVTDKVLVVPKSFG